MLREGKERFFLDFRIGGPSQDRVERDDCLVAGNLRQPEDGLATHFPIGVGPRRVEEDPGRLSGALLRYDKDRLPPHEL